MLCLIAKLDDGSTRKLESVRRACLAGLPDPGPLHGHITVAAFTGEDEASFLRSCRELAAGLGAFPVTYERIGVLEETSILVALPERAGALGELHRSVAERFAGELDEWTRPDRWLPHTTLYFGPHEDLHTLARRADGVFTPFTARVTALEFSRVLPAGYEIAGRVDLPG